MKKLWQKSTSADQEVEDFTVGDDRALDLLLAPFDIQGSVAHVKMLNSVGLLENNEANQLVEELIKIYKSCEQGDFQIQPEVEDVHSQVELMLTEKLGDIGKKVHSGRSRNDQVLVDMKLFIRAQLELITDETRHLFTLLQQLSEVHKDKLMPGYTHLQVAMPSSFGLWFGAFAESLVDDMAQVQSAYEVVNKNPLGSAAGYGNSFPLDRQMTTDLLGFKSLNINAIYAQMTRGKSERIVANALASIASTLSKLSMDCCLYMGQDFGFISFPENLTTGSSIMPHKKNPDVFEVVRGKCNKLQALPVEITMVMNNLPLGYHRDLQVIKENFIPAFRALLDCLKMTQHMLAHIKVTPDLLNNEKYRYIYSVELVNKLVLEGISFREAYQQVGKMIEETTYNPPREINHTHEGSVGNLCNDQVKAAFDEVYERFPFKKVKVVIDNLMHTQ
ncbi:MAG TPA: argininosuccinate lyase [Cyclobacteriaceae bacterium]